VCILVLKKSRYVSTAQQEEGIDLAATHAELVKIESAIETATAKHNEFLRELGTAVGRSRYAVDE
jgi:type I restriction enzyme M protein